MDNSVSDAQIVEWQGAIGREAVEVQSLDRIALRRFARAVGLSGEDAAVPLPHWAFFLPCPVDEMLGPDGHPKRGDFLPDITLPRRMFASASMTFNAPLEIGNEARFTSIIADVTHKSGRSGELVFAEVDRVLEQNGVERVRERQTYVYRGEGPPAPMPAPIDPIPDGEVWQPDEVNLFRFSAATFNSHRIHYDAAYARNIEGYPALVVHGPFTAARLAGLAMRGGELAEFAFKAMAPLFLGQPIVLRKTSDTLYEAIRCDGTPAMQAKVRYA